MIWLLGFPFVILLLYLSHCRGFRAGFIAGYMQNKEVVFKEAFVLGYTLGYTHGEAGVVPTVPEQYKNADLEAKKKMN